MHDEEVNRFYWDDAGEEMKAFDNMGGNAEDLAFRPMHVKPFYVCVMKGFLFVIGDRTGAGNQFFTGG